MKIIFLASLLVSTLAHGDEAPKGTIELNPKVYKEKPFRKIKNTTVKQIPKGVPHPNALPDKEHREAVFARVPDLELAISKMDELDRDLLYMRARNDTAAELQEKHPQIPAAVLAKLQTEAKKP